MDVMTDAATLALVRSLCRSGEARRIREGSLSLSEAAAAIGTSATVLSRWERGIATPKRAALCERYAALLTELLEMSP